MNPVGIYPEFQLSIGDKSLRDLSPIAALGEALAFATVGALELVALLVEEVEAALPLTILGCTRLLVGGRAGEEGDAAAAEAALHDFFALGSLGGGDADFDKAATLVLSPDLLLELEAEGLGAVAGVGA